MSTESQMIVWKSEGLPSDAQSMENAIVVRHTKHCCFIIDPLAQAAGWLRCRFKAEHVTYEVVSHTDVKFTTSLKLAVRFGRKLIVQDVDKIEPMLYPLLRNDLTCQGSKLTVTIGGEVLDHDEGFELFLLTRDSSLYVPPDTLSLVVQTDFTVTHSSLEKQLVTLTLLHENPKIEEQKHSIIQVFPSPKAVSLRSTDNTNTDLWRFFLIFMSQRNHAG